MPEPTDAIMPILQRIQGDVADVKRDLGETKRDLAETKRELGGKIDALSDGMVAMSNRMEAFEDYFIYTMGLTQQNTIDIKRMRSDIDAINFRLPKDPR